MTVILENDKTVDAVVKRATGVAMRFGHKYMAHWRWGDTKMSCPVIRVRRGIYREEWALCGKGGIA